MQHKTIENITKQNRNGQSEFIETLQNKLCQSVFFRLQNKTLIFL